ncbi:hypothetical protein DFH28DRAFT_1117242 [Melampsora americana]|nr:hypothetical protein DFH28DRAFT_1117242 [Melampsora americana]
MEPRMNMHFMILTFPTRLILTTPNQTIASSTFEISPAPSRSSTSSPHLISESSKIVPLLRNSNSFLAPPVLLRHPGPLHPQTIHRNSSCAYATQLMHTNYPPEQYPTVGLSSAPLQSYQLQPQYQYPLNFHPDPTTFASAIYPPPTFFVSSAHEDHSSVLPGAALHSHRPPTATQLVPPASHTQIQLQPLPRLMPSHPHRQLSLQPPAHAINMQRSFSEIPTTGNWGGNMSFVPHQHHNASQVRSGLLSQQFMPLTPSVNSEVGECDIDPFAQLSARTLALMDQPESEVTIYDCEYCEKTYQGKHARSIWRRHLSDKHKIPLATQPRRTRWDNDANRPKTEEERRERTLESKRRWARKNRAAKKAARENQRFGAVAPLSNAIRGPNRDSDSRASSPSHSVSVSPSSYPISLPTESSRSTDTLLVPGPNTVRSQSLQVPGPNPRDSVHPMARVSSVPLATSSNPASEPSTHHQLSYDTSISTPQFLPADWSFQISTPIMTNPYNLQSFPQLQLGGSIRERMEHDMMASQDQHRLRHSQHFDPSERPHTMDSQFFSSKPPSYSHHHGLQPLYDVHVLDSKGQNMRAQHAPQIAHFANPPVTWSSSVKLESSFPGDRTAPITESPESKRPRFAQYLSLPVNAQVHDSTNTSSLTWPEASKDQSSSVAHSAVKLSHRPSSGLYTTEAEAKSEDSDQSSEASDRAFLEHTESRTVEEGEEVEKAEHEDEDDAPICSAASSTRCSTSAGLPGGDASLSFSFSELDQQTPARPTGLRAMTRSAFVSPREVGEDGPNGLGLFSSPMIGRSDADSSLYNGAFAPLSVSKSGKQRHHATVCSSGGSVSHWSTTLQTPSDLSRHPGRKESFGGSGLMMSPSGAAGLFSSPQHPNLSKSLGLAPSGGDSLVGFMGSSWDLNH